MAKEYKDLRNFLKSDKWIIRDKMETPKDLGKDRPSAVKQYNQDSKLIDLPNTYDLDFKEESIIKLIKKRESRRKYNNKFLNKNELSYLLWATQGKRNDHLRLRTVPSGGAVHPFETYIYINRVDQIKEGLYRYLPDKHSLLFIKDIKDSREKIIKAANNQKFVADAAVVFFWTVIPTRGEWKYGELAHKLAAIDAGHVCQNLYLAVESLGAGTCAIDAYNQKMADQLLDIDGDEEFVIYMAPVGKLNE